MKILMVVDISWWAIGHLAQGIIDKNPHIEFKMFEYPPRELETKREEFRKVLAEFNPDIIHFQYWRTCDYVLNNVPEVLKYRKVLSHHNEKNLLSADWSGVDVITCQTELCLDRLQKYPNVVLINLAVDGFEYNENYPPKEVRLGYVGRIVPWKGFKEVVKVCKELNTRFIAMVGGRIEKPQYINEIQAEVGEIERYGEIMFGIDDDDRQGIYNQMTFYIGNSSDGRETGPLGLLEAMASGVPVITTPSGTARDIIKDGENGFLVEFDNYESLKSKVSECLKLLETKEGLAKLNKIRNNAWDTVKNMNYDKMGYLYQLLYNNLYYTEPLVSVIIPTYNRLDNIKTILGKLHDYCSIEVVIADDNSDDGTKKWYENNKFKYPFTVKYINTEKDGYNLAMARNLAVIEATGEYLVFLDSRLYPKQFGITNLIKPLLEGGKIWSYGKKGGFDKKSFVENWSAIRREHLIKAGMFNERITEYGGMSQELRARFSSQGFDLKYTPDAEAEIISKSGKKGRRKQIQNMKSLLLKLGL